MRIINAHDKIRDTYEAETHILLSHIILETHMHRSACISEKVKKHPLDSEEDVFSYILIYS